MNKESEEAEDNPFVVVPALSEYLGEGIVFVAFDKLNDDLITNIVRLQLDEIGQMGLYNFEEDIFGLGGLPCIPFIFVYYFEYFPLLS